MFGNVDVLGGLGARRDVAAAHLGDGDGVEDLRGGGGLEARHVAAQHDLGVTDGLID
jgi:hypothetical protein